LWLLKLLFLHGGVDDFILVGVGSVALNPLLSGMYIFVGFCLFFRVLLSNIQDHGVKETQRPLSINCTVCEFV
jgi:hypothetical protein